MDSHHFELIDSVCACGFSSLKCFKIAPRTHQYNASRVKPCFDRCKGSTTLEARFICTAFSMQVQHGKRAKLSVADYGTEQMIFHTRNANSKTDDDHLITHYTCKLVTSSCHFNDYTYKALIYEYIYINLNFSSIHLHLV